MAVADKPSTVAGLVLGMVSKGWRSGYEVKRMTDRAAGRFWGASNAQIYPELKRLAAAGLLRSQQELTGNRARIAYTVTAEGRRELRRWLTDDSKPRLEMRDEAMLKLFFADELGREYAISVLTEKADTHAALAENMQTRVRPPNPWSDYERLTWEYSIALHVWIAAWCRDKAATLAEKPDVAEKGPQRRPSTTT